MSKSKTLKTMTAGECSTERSRHRNAIGFLALERMLPDRTAGDKARIDGDILKRRRPIKRLERQIAIVSQMVEVAA